MHSIHNQKCPEYLAGVVQATAAGPHRYGLRSVDSSDFILPRLRTKFGERSFSYAGPAAWNRLPEDIRSTTNIESFKKALKTYLFNLAYFG